MRMSIIPEGHESRKTEEVKWPTVAMAQAAKIASNKKKKKKKKKDFDGDFDSSGQGTFEDEDDE